MKEAIAIVRKNDTAQVRVTRSEWKGRWIIDVRVWCVPHGGGEPVPTRKGVTLDASKCGELIEALRSIDEFGNESPTSP